MSIIKAENESISIAPDSQSSTTAAANMTKKHIRGSTLLLAGRIISLGLNFIVQILTVRYLAKSDYGAFAYALNVVSMGSSLILFGSDKAISRFVPIYQENGDYRKMFGAIMLAISLITGLGMSFALVFFGIQHILLERANVDPLALSLLLVLIALSPLQSLNSLFESLMAIFASPKAIFFRRHILGPGLRLAAVLLVMITAGNVRVLAYGYLIGGALGVIVYIAMMVQVWHAQGLMQRFSLRKMTMPVREILGFSAPLLSTDLVLLLRSSLVVIMLEYFRSTVDVAEYRAVLPVAKLNLVVLQSFSFLFIPLAARMFARNDREGINDLYWQTALWITVMSFPIFAVSFSLSRPLTILLFGARYANSAVVLSLLSFGYYFNAALGFNSYTLRVYGKVRYIVVIDIVAAVLSLGINLLLIPRYGAVGAAIGAASTLVIHNILNHTGLLVSGTGIKLFEWRYLRVYSIIALSALSLWMVQEVASPPVYVSFMLAAIISTLVIRLNRKVFNIEETFPELLRVPLMRRLLT